MSHTQQSFGKSREKNREKIRNSGVNDKYYDRIEEAIKFYLI